MWTGRSRRTWSSDAEGGRRTRGRAACCCRSAPEKTCRGRRHDDKRLIPPPRPTDRSGRRRSPSHLPLTCAARRSAAPPRSRCDRPPSSPTGAAEPRGGPRTWALSSGRPARLSSVYQRRATGFVSALHVSGRGQLVHVHQPGGGSAAAKGRSRLRFERIWGIWEEAAHLSDPGRRRRRRPPSCGCR